MVSKAGKLDIIWFEKEDHRKDLKAALSKKGKLHLGRPLREALPATISLGFNREKKLLVIADGNKLGAASPKSGIIEFRGLAAEITKTGFQLPVRFRFSFDRESGFWLGSIVLKKQSADYMEQLLIVYRHIVDRAVCQYAKTTPIEERKALALEALCTAAAEYQPWQGELEEYLADSVKKRLLLENKKFTAVSGHERISLDAPFSAEAGECFCRYDVLENSFCGGITDMEERIAFEQFADCLAERERTVVQRLQTGFTIREIACELGLEEEQIYGVAGEISRKRKDFYGVA